MPAVLIVIPARLASSRIARKPLVSAGGYSLLWHTLQAARKAACELEDSDVVVATDSPEILGAIGGDCRTILSSVPYWCGSQRTAAVAQQAGVSDSDFVVNWQVDEPLVRPEDVVGLVARLGEEAAAIATLVAKARPSSAADKNRVKVEVAAGECSDFSRTAPFNHEHIGVYGFHAGTLRELQNLGPCPRSQHESLEQLSWLGRYRIVAARIDAAPMSINTTADLETFRRHCRRKGIGESSIE